jgi:trinucleotide repeat-containing gene 6 protein
MWDCGKDGDNVSSIIQILNQPLAPQTLILLNQLLQQIKVLQQLMQQQAVVQVQQPMKGNSTAVLHISVQITKTKQQIQNLQVTQYSASYKCDLLSCTFAY